MWRLTFSLQQGALEFGCLPGGYQHQSSAKSTAPLAKYSHNDVRLFCGPLFVSDLECKPNSPNNNQPRFSLRCEVPPVGGKWCCWTSCWTSALLFLHRGTLMRQANVTFNWSDSFVPSVIMRRGGRCWIDKREEVPLHHWTERVNLHKLCFKEKVKNILHTWPLTF